ncbi:hypothetical protein C8Q78DRAFT_1042618 [Trametes maxima]|nr:hypothetical protein C8Q78DRAFT_1042618 [Trametes maxima]
MALYQIYREQVERRWKGWQKRRSSQTQYVPQLEWAAHVVEYVNWIHGLVSTKLASGPLRAVVPLLGPRFIPPGYLHATRRNLTVDIQPETAYVKALTVIHPLYFPELAKCPRCELICTSTSWSPLLHEMLCAYSRPIQPCYRAAPVDDLCRYWCMLFAAPTRAALAPLSCGTACIF